MHVASGCDSVLLWWRLIRYVLPVVLMTSRGHILVRHMRHKEGRRLLRATDKGVAPGGSLTSTISLLIVCCSVPRQPRRFRVEALNSSAVIVSWRSPDDRLQPAPPGLRLHIYITSSSYNPGFLAASATRN